MGGYGSTRWAWYSKKTTVGECRAIDTRNLLAWGYLEPDMMRRGGVKWWRDDPERPTASIGIFVNTVDSPPYVSLDYTIIDTDGEKRDYAYRVRLLHTQPNFGGVRWWFACPMSINGRYCGRRVRKLYLPPGGRYFGCRHCYNLSYESTQTWDKRVAALRRLPIDVLWSMVDTSGPDLFRVLQALGDEYDLFS